MFCGTMRQNLDPFGRHSDAAIWAALEAVMLGPYISGLQEKLESEVSCFSLKRSRDEDVFFGVYALPTAK